MKKQKPEAGQLRTQLIQIAYNILAHEGVDELSFARLAGHCKTTRAHVRYYFKSKKDLVLACYAEVAHRGQAEREKWVSNAHTWQERLRGYVDGNFNWYAANPDDMAIIFIFSHYCQTDKKLAAEQLHIREIGRNRIASILKSGAKRQFPAALFAQYAAEIQSLITGFLVDSATSGDPKSAKTYRKYARNRVDEIIETLEKP